MTGVAPAPPVRWRSEAKEIGGFYTFLKSEVDKLKAAEGRMRTHAMKQCDVLLKEYVSFNPYIQRLYFQHQRVKKAGDSRYPQAYRYSIARPRFASIWDSSPAAVKRDSASRQSVVSSYRSESSSEYTSSKIMSRTPKPERGRNKSPVTAEYRSDSRNPERPGGYSRKPPELIRYRSPDSNPERASPYRISEVSPHKYRKGNQYEGETTAEKTLPSQRTQTDRSTFERTDRAAESTGRLQQLQEPQQSSYTARYQAGNTPLGRVRTGGTDMLRARNEDAKVDMVEDSAVLPMSYSNNYTASGGHHGMSYLPDRSGYFVPDCGAAYQDEGTQTLQGARGGGGSYRTVHGDPAAVHRGDLIDTSSSSSQATAKGLEGSSNRQGSPSKVPIGGIYSYKVPAGGTYRMADFGGKLAEARAEGNVYVISDGNQYRPSEGRSLAHVQVGHLLYGNQDRVPEQERNRVKTPEGLFRQKRRKKFAPHRCDVKELIPEQRPMKRKYIQNKVPETRKYTFYKYYGFAGQGAKTSWAHNRPLGLSPPHAQRGAPQLEPETLVTT